MSYFDCDYVVVDVETTGISPKYGHRVIEVAAIRLDSQARAIDSYTTLINPETSVGPTYIHGIEQEDVVNAPLFEEVAGDIAQMLKGAIFVAHNAWFDYQFLRSEYSELGIILPDLPRLCTLQLARKLLPELPSKKLTSCCEHFDIDLDLAHCAFDDALATSELLQQLFKLAQRERLSREQMKVKDLHSLKDCFPRIEPSKLFLYRPGYESFVKKTERKIKSQAKRRRLKEKAVKRKAKVDTSFIDGLILKSAKKRKLRKARRYFEALDRAMLGLKTTEAEHGELNQIVEDEGLSFSEAKQLNRRWYDSVSTLAEEQSRLSSNQNRELNKLKSLLGI